MKTEYEFSILLVDDAASNLFILNQILKDDYVIYTARSGAVALELAQKEQPDLILLDVIMPDINGFEVLAELKRSDATRHIPIIFITGLTNVEDEHKGLQLGAVDYITKPFNSVIVKARVETHLKIVKQMRTIERFGMIDSLTELQNRRSFDNQINVEWMRAVREKNPISLLMIDLDNFKKLNDIYGHLFGDIVLKNIAKVFVSTLNRTTDLVFRWGGEEFATVLPNTNLNGALFVAEKIRANVETMDIENKSLQLILRVTVSIGVASTIPNRDSSIADFILESDKALYLAKNTGKNKVCF